MERVSWFSPIHYEIMEFFEEYDIQASPAVVARNIDYDSDYTNRELGTLVDAGFLEKPTGGYYMLTEKGRGFLFGEIDPDGFPEPGDSSE